jgi:outer membrane protein
MIAGALLGTTPVLAGIASMDVFGTSQVVPQYGEGALQNGGACADPQPAGSVSLRDALDRALCYDPKVRSAWQDVKVKAAQLGEAKAAYLPTVEANWQAIRDNSDTDVHGHPDLSSSDRALIQTVDATMSLMLWDFGSRTAATHAAREMVISANETYRAALETAFATVAKDYYSALGAAGTATATREAAEAARKTQEAAQMRVEHGAAAISDALQAETSYEQAEFEYEKAESDYRAAKGVLALDMGQDPTLPFSLPDIEATGQLKPIAASSVHDLLEEANENDPNIASAVAQKNAALAQIDKAVADGLPSVSLQAKYTRNNQPASLGLGIPEFPATGRDWYVGIVVKIPLFEGFTRSYQIREAEAKAAEQDEVVGDARRQVASGIWTTFEAVTAGGENVQSSERLLKVAEQSFDVANHRYQAGAGSILELLNAQSALARAKKQRVTSLSDFGAATLQLAAKLGRLRDW